MFLVLNSLYVLSKSQKNVVDDVSELVCYALLPPPSIIPKFKEYIIIKAMDRVVISGKYPDLSSSLSTPDIGLKISNFLKYLIRRYGCPIRGPCEMSYEFYIKNGGYKDNSPFLFGTPSQKRKKY